MRAPSDDLLWKEKSDIKEECLVVVIPFQEWDDVRLLATSSLDKEGNEFHLRKIFMVK